jgi:hypothetical protein
MLAVSRPFLAASVVLAGVTTVAFSKGQPRHDRSMTIHGEFHGRSVVVAATERSGGAIESLQWGDVEFIDANDHGRLLQSAVTFDGLGECDNPTEAGASRDGQHPKVSSSILESHGVVDNVLKTSTRMAYWIRKGQRSHECSSAVNEGDPSPTSSTVLQKTVRFLPGFENVLEHRISFMLPRTRNHAQFEVLTAYMPIKFGTFHTFNPATGAMETLSDGPGEQNHPVVLATADGHHALALCTLQPGAARLNGPGYGRWRFEGARVTKSNVVFRQDGARLGSHDFVAYSVFGSLEDVRVTLVQLYGREAPVLTQSLPASTRRALADN